eukprot:971603-Karenia_brevis.AAC.1
MRNHVPMIRIRSVFVEGMHSIQFTVKMTTLETNVPTDGIPWLHLRPSNPCADTAVSKGAIA